MSSSDKPILGPMGDGMRQKLLAEFVSDPTTETVLIEDESHLHKGHAGVRDSKTPETHFNVRVVSAKFEGVSRVNRQKMVYALFTHEFDEQGLHALQLKCDPPASK